MSGRDTLTRIDGVLNQERASMTESDRRIGEVSNQLLELRKARVQDFLELARLRVDMISADDIVPAIDHADRQVAAVLQERESVIKALDAKIRAVEHDREALEAERSVQAERLEEAAEALDLAEAETQARLDADPDYRAQQERTQEAERIAKHAEDKALRSEREEDEKGRSYSNDSLFMYLWERGYGTPKYRAMPLIRWLDGKVARLIGFEDARANYARLREIPVRLREHAEDKKRAAELEFAALRELDEKAREKDGIGALEGVMDEEQSKLEAVDARLEQVDEDLLELRQHVESFAAGEDQEYRKAVDYLAAELRRDDIQELRRDALATPFPEDDLIINRLLEHEEHEQALERSLRELKDALYQQRGRLEEIESMRRDFKRRQYERRGGGFADGALVAMTIGNFLNGVLKRDDLWRVLEGQRRAPRRRANPTFGSGGFGRGTVWGGGGGMGGGGGFGTGGGIGGRGGFRTGGGF